MKKITVKNCEECPYYYEECDFDENLTETPIRHCNNPYHPRYQDVCFPAVLTDAEVMDIEFDPDCPLENDNSQLPIREIAARDKMIVEWLKTRRDTNIKSNVRL